MNVLTEDVALYQMDDFFEQTDPACIFTATDLTTEATPDDLNDHALRRAIDKVADATPRSVLMAVFQEAMAREGIDTNVLHGDAKTFSVQGTYQPDEEGNADSLHITYGTARTSARTSSSSTSASW